MALSRSLSLAPVFRSTGSRERSVRRASTRDSAALLTADHDAAAGCLRDAGIDPTWAVARVSHSCRSGRAPCGDGGVRKGDLRQPPDRRAQTSRLRWIARAARLAMRTGPSRYELSPPDSRRDHKLHLGPPAFDVGIETERRNGCRAGHASTLTPKSGRLL